VLKQISGNWTISMENLKFHGLALFCIKTMNSVAWY